LPINRQSYLPAAAFVGDAMTEDFEQRLVEFAKKLVARAPDCKNEEATKTFLILPFLRLLGYDTEDPHVIEPEHAAAFADKYKSRVDYVIKKAGKPVIAIECKAFGHSLDNESKNAGLKDDRGQLRSYFNAVESVKLGVLTDGLYWGFFLLTLRNPI
jgi:hypothetical protein